jgi:hypothetical protein
VRFGLALHVAGMPNVKIAARDYLDAVRCGLEADLD